jgi:3-oxo-5alpha-steroid 4-dehydrogenase
VQKAVGMEDSRDNMYKYLSAAVGDGANLELIGILCDKSLELYDWLVKNGVQFKPSFYTGGKTMLPMTEDGLVYSGDEAQEPYCSIAKSVPRGHHAKGAGGMTGYALFKPLKNAVTSSGTEVVYEAFAKQLVVDSNGRVIGVVYTTTDGATKRVHARRGVVLTAGGFAANRDMVAQHSPAFLRAGALVGTPTDDGMGIRMGQSVRGDVQLMSDMSGAFSVYVYSENLVKGILVNDKGQRFAGEDHYADWTGGEVVRRHPVSYIVFDDTVKNQVPEASLKYMNIVAKADSITGLATALKIPELLLENTVKVYNEMCDAGQDLQFHKNHKFLTGIKTGPFYALDFSAGTIPHMSKGGLKINKDSQVLDPFGKPVPGLYSAGANAFGGVIAQHYAASGSATAQAFTFGRIAGKNAAENPVA